MVDSSFEWVLKEFYGAMMFVAVTIHVSHKFPQNPDYFITSIASLSAKSMRESKKKLYYHIYPLWILFRVEVLSK